MKHLRSFCLGLALALALCLSVLTVSVPASAHSSIPAQGCSLAKKQFEFAWKTRDQALVVSALEALLICEGVSSPAVVPSSPFSLATNPFEFNPGFGFGGCPAGSGLVQVLPLPAAAYECRFGQTGFGVTPLCGGPYRLLETTVAPWPAYACVL